MGPGPGLTLLTPHENPCPLGRVDGEWAEEEEKGEGGGMGGKLRLECKIKKKYLKSI